MRPDSWIKVARCITQGVQTTVLSFEPSLRDLLQFPDACLLLSYRDWLMLYASPEFAEVQQWMRTKVDQWAKVAGDDEKRRMEEAFIISSRYEWMFWEMAWKEEEWPV